MSKTRTTAREVTVTERRELHEALQGVELSREEELVLRLRHGIPAARSTHLDYRGQSDPEMSARLAMIEAEALAHARPEPAGQPEPSDASDALKRALIDELRKL